MTYRAAARYASETAVRIDGSYTRLLNLGDRIYIVVIIIAVEVVEEFARNFRMILTYPAHLASYSSQHRCYEFAVKEGIFFELLEPFRPLIRLKLKEYVIHLLEIFVGARHREYPFTEVVDFIEYVDDFILLIISGTLCDFH